MRSAVLLIRSTFAVVTILVCYSAGPAHAQAYPTKPISLIIPFAVGGSNDTLARIITERMRVTLGQPFVIENITGAGGTIAVGKVARAGPDGYTLSLGSVSSHVINGGIYPLDYDLAKAFAPVALLTSSPLVIVAKTAHGDKNLGRFIDWLKANPDKAWQGTAGVGNITHIAGIRFQQQTGTRFGFTPYRGSAPASQDLIAGRIDFMIDPAATAVPPILAGTIMALAVAGPKRLPSLPDLPTVDEAGLPGFHITIWNAIWAPAGTPRPVIDKLNKAIVAALAEPAVQKRLSDLGQEVPPAAEQTPESLGRLHAQEIERWWPIAKAAGIKLE